MPEPTAPEARDPEARRAAVADTLPADIGR